MSDTLLGQARRLTRYWRRHPDPEGWLVASDIFEDLGDEENAKKWRVLSDLVGNWLPKITEAYVLCREGARRNRTVADLWGGLEVFFEKCPKSVKVQVKLGGNYQNIDYHNTTLHASNWHPMMPNWFGDLWMSNKGPSHEFYQRKMLDLLLVLRANIPY